MSWFVFGRLNVNIEHVPSVALAWAYSEQERRIVLIIKFLHKSLKQ